MAPRLQLIHSKVQHAAAIADGTAQGIEGHVADPPKVLSSENYESFWFTKLGLVCSPGLAVLRSTVRSNVKPKCGNKSS